MTSKASDRKWNKCAKPLVAGLMSVAFLTACSTLSEDARMWAAKGELEKKAAAAQPLVNDVRSPPPDIPPHLVNCIEKKPKPGKTANEKVTNELQTADERRACMRAILAWYKEIQKAEKERGQKRASADPPRLTP